MPIWGLISQRFHVSVKRANPSLTLFPMRLIHPCESAAYHIKSNSESPNRIFMTQ